MISKELLNLNKSRGFAEKIGDALAFLRLNTSVLLQAHLFISLPIIIVLAGAFFLLFNGYFSLLEVVDSGIFLDDVAEQFEKNAWFIQNILFPAFAFSVISAVTFLVLHIYEQAARPTITFQDVTAQLKQLPRLLGVKLVILPLIFLPYLLLLTVDDEVGRYMLLIFVVGPISVVPYTLLTCAELLVLQHGYNPFKAMGRSFSVMGKYFWPAFAVHTVTLGLYLITTALLETPAWVADSLEGVAVLDWDMDNVWGMAGKAFHAFSALAGYLLFILPPLVAGVEYFSIKERVQRKNIMDKINLIGEDEQPKDIYAEDEQY